METADLERLLKKWQSILRLRDWDITIAQRRRFEGPGDRSAEIDVDWEQMRAHIAMVDRGDFPPDRKPPLNSIEHDILHELLHIVTWKMGTKPGTPEQDAEELAINQLARAFLVLDQR
jgi:hypothetical protein